jgi:ABC-type glycerol-3-phosphate transport system substrate-binding protein
VKALNDAVASFEQAIPDIKVQLTYVPFGQLLSRTLQTAAVHRPPAISALDNPLTFHPFVTSRKKRAK